MKSIESKLISIENQLKVNWFQLKSLLKLAILKTVEGGEPKKIVIQYTQIVWRGGLH